MAEDKIFADGFSFKRRENAPDFVVGNVNVKVDDAIAFLKKNNKKGWCTLNINQARSGNYYMELDTWEPKAEASTKETEKDGLPF
jgi:hypothetical protein|tara:strand:+ start:933 stop:1187 length:255 start_codon:yes stop_codon:yes gene_type:complete